MQINLFVTTLSFFQLDESPINVDVELYSILLGHEEAIYGLCWYPNTGKFF